MPDRTKCLHALAAHELAVPGANSLGREALDAAGQWWSRSCFPGRRPSVPADENQADVSGGDEPPRPQEAE